MKVFVVNNTFHIEKIISTGLYEPEDLLVVIPHNITANAGILKNKWHIILPRFEYRFKFFLKYLLILSSIRSIIKNYQFNDVMLCSEQEITNLIFAKILYNHGCKIGLVEDGYLTTSIINLLSAQKVLSIKQRIKKFIAEIFLSKHFIEHIYIGSHQYNKILPSHIESLYATMPNTSRGKIKVKRIEEKVTIPERLIPGNCLVLLPPPNQIPLDKITKFLGKIIVNFDFIVLKIHPRDYTNSYKKYFYNNPCVMISSGRLLSEDIQHHCPQTIFGFDSAGLIESQKYGLLAKNVVFSLDTTDEYKMVREIFKYCGVDEVKS